MGYTPIEDYAIIGNCHTAALISKRGSIDWWCPYRFDRPSVFGALLDDNRGGYFQIQPAQSYSVDRRYIGRTNVLETTFTTETGRLRLVDLKPILVEQKEIQGLHTHHAVLRKIECIEGEVEVELWYEPRPDYGRTTVDIQHRMGLGYLANFDGNLLAFRTDMAVDVVGSRALRSQVRLRNGDRRYAGVSFVPGEPGVLPPLGDHAERQIDQTLTWWNNWISRCEYEGPFKEAVLRSALVLRLMIYAPSGAIVAAPTTSLPETIGGSRNWDYRYCWLRDATLTMRAFLDLGYRAEGRAFLNWLLRNTWLSWPRLEVLYDVFGGRKHRERTLPHLDGYRSSRPVRVGNAASEQFQLDIYGEVVGAAYEFIQHGGTITKTEADQLRTLGKMVCRLWDQPDNGLWEVRSRRRHHTHSKVLCWMALDHLIELDQDGHLSVPVKHFKSERRRIREAIENRAFSEELGSYVSAFDGNTVDASLLMIGIHGYREPGDPRMQSTFNHMKNHLVRNGLWYRYTEVFSDGVPGSEATFGICSFWAAHYMALAGQHEEACRQFERVLAGSNDLGLFSEEIDSNDFSQLGNFPQAFTHIGLIDAAVALEREISGVRARQNRRNDSSQ